MLFTETYLLKVAGLVEETERTEKAEDVIREIGI
jgi:hypothetical protein